MKEQLEKLGLEMIQEIKDLKDLAKGELPEVAKEYVKYIEISSLIYMIVFGLITLIMIAGCVYTSIHGEEYSLAPLLTGIGGLLGGIPMFLAFNDYLEAKLTPKRTAIKSITNLF